MKKKSDFYTALEETELKKQETSSEFQSQNSKPLRVPREVRKHLSSTPWRKERERKANQEINLLFAFLCQKLEMTPVYEKKV